MSTTSPTPSPLREVEEFALRFATETTGECVVTDGLYQWCRVHQAVFSSDDQCSEFTSTVTLVSKALLKWQGLIG